MLPLNMSAVLGGQVAARHLGPLVSIMADCQQLAEAATLLHTEHPLASHPPAPPQVASATNDVAGDGTTTATVLTRAILVEGCKSVAAGMNPMDLRRGINLAVGVAFLCMWHSCLWCGMPGLVEGIAPAGMLAACGDHACP